MARRLSRVSTVDAPNVKRTNETGNATSQQHRKRKQKGLNAFSIASKIDPGHTKVKQHRLGEAEGEEPYRKRRRLLDDQEAESEVHASDGRRRQEKVVKKGEKDDLDISGGSDGEGNEWRTGVDDEDDTDIDSDEAFGESDEEKYEGFTFRGSTSKKSKRHKAHDATTRSAKSITLEEDEDQAQDVDYASDDSLGSDAVDLATMLDDDRSSDSGERKADRGVRDVITRDAERTDDLALSQSDEEFEGFDEGLDLDTNAMHTYNEPAALSDEESVDYEDDLVADAESIDENEDISAAERLQSAVSALPRGDGSVDEDATNLQSHRPAIDKSAMLKMMSNSDLGKVFKRSMKSTISSLGDGPSSMVKQPLPKRQQDRLDRAAAYDQAKQTLDRWIDTVKHNRRAEHLSFPLIDPNSTNARGSNRLLPLQSHKSSDHLDNAVNDILLQSGLGGASSKDEKAEDVDGDDLKANQIPYEKVVARRNELRKARDILFREEKRSRHINKIKSKAYRRVHRKEKERAEAKEKPLLASAGIELSDEEKEKNDRRRATERMGARHRESRWAKGVKSGDRAAWDDEARSSMIDMARRDEELRQRIEGKPVRRDDEDSDGIVRDDSSDEGDFLGEGDDTLEKSLFRLRDDAPDDSPGANKSKLASMGFMQRADAARRQLNNDTIDDIHRTLNGEIVEDQSDPEITPGRQIFGPKTDKSQPSTAVPVRSELEEGHSSDDEHVIGADAITLNDPMQRTHRSDDSHRDSSTIHVAKKPAVNDKTSKSSIRSSLKASAKIAGTTTESNDKDTEVNGAEASQVHSTDAARLSLAGKTTNWQTVPNPATNDPSPFQDDRESADEEEEFVAPTNEELVKAAFGGDDVEEDFHREKRAAAESEDDKVIDNALPGWGSWTGEGVSKRQQNRNKGKFITKEGGIKPSNRKDAKLERVILSEKRIKKNSKYLASSLPHPFETKQQYERSLRIPIGPEWTTKESFQNATKPRVMVKQGIIRPMAKPLL